jgi:hypothetical protein
MNGTPILPWEMITYIMRFALRVFVNKDLVRELSLLKEGTYSKGLGVLDIHVMLPSHIAEINISDADFVFPSWGISMTTGLGEVLLGVLVFAYCKYKRGSCLAKRTVHGGITTP